MLQISNFGYNYKTNGHVAVTPNLQIEGYPISELTAQTVTELGKAGLQKRVVFFTKSGERLSQYFPYGKGTSLGEIDSNNICNEMAIRELENQNGKIYRAVSISEANEWEAANNK